MENLESAQIYIIPSRAATSANEHWKADCWALSGGGSCLRTALVVPTVRPVPSNQGTGARKRQLVQ